MRLGQRHCLQPQLFHGSTYVDDLVERTSIDLGLATKSIVDTQPYHTPLLNACYQPSIALNILEVNYIRETTFRNRMSPSLVLPS